MKQTVKRKQYIKGDFVGKYRGKQQETTPYSPHAIYNINIYESEVYNAVVCSRKDSDQIPKVNCQYYSELTDTIVHIASRFEYDESYFQEDLFDVKIYEIKLSYTTKEDKYTFGTIKGKICAAIIFEEEIEDSTCRVRKKITNDEKVASEASETVTDKESEKVVSEVSEKATDKESESDLKVKLTNFTTSPNRVKKPKRPVIREKLGCMNILTWLFYILMLFALVGFISAFGLKGIIIIVVLILLWLFISNFSKVFITLGRWLLSIFSGAFILLLIIGLFSALFTDTFKHHRSDHKDKKEEQTQSVSDNTLPNHDSVISHYRIWNDYQNHRYEGSIEVLKSDFNNSRTNRQNQNLAIQNEKSWTELYKNLVKNDRKRLNRIYLMLDSIQLKKKLSDRKFANVIVSFVQDIPYTLIVPGSCYELYRTDPYIAQLMDNQVECFGKIDYGIQAPAEFMGNLKGDCDTRTILLYCLLSKFGYDVIVLGSTYYQHSILGVNLPSTGLYKSHNGKKYYVWETTAPGLQLGQISPDQTNMKLWNVHLTNYNN